jgi:enamine deaminase RidA (YjgF/YER057c/UK114 family)
MPDPLKELDLPEPPAPVGAYERGMVHNGIGFLSGQFPLRDGKLVHTGRVGAELTETEGRHAAEIAALNAISGIRAVLGGDLADLVSLLRVDGYVASADGFLRIPWVLDGASETFRRMLGDRGRHARTAFAVPRLPLDAPVELVVTFGVSGKRT